ncbi:hypothetical protein TorRG33x02_132300 [Trema orientale]|uniref:Uncharacterized protein n=1 Tax=Trema orientale TaxID=63057 RepID=A0A2P5EZQ6_TREOI|nr:hypothetical protein TorRG33x02_132300 [Trema orientale]
MTRQMEVSPPQICKEGPSLGSERRYRGLRLQPRGRMKKATMRLRPQVAMPMTPWHSDANDSLADSDDKFGTDEVASMITLGPTSGLLFAFAASDICLSGLEPTLGLSALPFQPRASDRT